MRCLVRASSDTSLLEGSASSSRSATSRTPARWPRAVDGCRLRPALRRAGLRLGDRRGDRRDQRRRARATCSEPPWRRRYGASSTSAPPTSTAIRRRRRSTRPHVRLRFATGTRRPSAGPRRRSVASEAGSALETVILRPATVYGPRLDGCDRRDRAGDPRRQHAADRPRPRRRRPLLRREPDRRGDPGAAHEARPGNAFNVSDGLDVTWKDFTDGLADGLGCPPGPLEHPLPAGDRPRLLARARLSAAAPRHGAERRRRCSRARRCRCSAATRTSATARLRELLGWEPRVDYATGLQATVAWLNSEYLARA